MKKLILSLARRVKNLAAQGRTAWKQASRCRRERILVLLISPLTAFWLMQFFFGAMPWEINPGAALANWICLGAVYWLACGLFGHVARFSVLLASAGRCVGHGKLFCLELPRYAHPAVGLLRAGHCRSCRGQLSVYGDLGDGRGRHPARGARVEPAPSVR